MSAKMAYLVADIGGTNARFGIARGDSKAGFQLEQIRRFKNEDFEHLGDAAHAYLEAYDGDRPQRGCVAIAGPVNPGLIQLTNSKWSFEPETLARHLGLQTLLPVNDFAAQARGAPLVAAADKVTIRDADANPNAPRAVLGPGTGLGLGLLISQPSGLVVISTEGGHAGFAARTDEQREVGRVLAREFGFTSWERLLSGAGMVNIHRALCELEGLPETVQTPEEITRKAMTDTDSVSRRAVDLFCSLLGGYAGDVAVMTGARGGVYLTGGILQSIQPLLESSDFEKQFIERGPMSRYNEAIPVWLIVCDEAPLLGAAALAEKGGL